jgi:hypothetical protein
MSKLNTVVWLTARNQLRIAQGSQYRLFRIIEELYG